jgi:hypothetical protein
MNGRLPLLAGILVLQLVLVVLIGFFGSSGETAEPFLDLESDRVTSVTIADGEGASVELTRNESGWVVAGLPAGSDRIQGVLDSLLEESARWPVATSAGAQSRFEVTADSHQRHLTFGADGEVIAEVYLGTSPGFRRVHARREGEDAVYSIDFALHEVPVDAGEWLDKKLLVSEEVSTVALADGSRLTRNDAGDGWLLDGAAADPDAARRLVERIEGLTVLGLHEGGMDDLKAPRVVVVEDAEGEHRLTFRHDEAEDRYVVTSGRIDGTFTVASYIAEQVLIGAEDVLPAPEVAPEVEEPVDGGGEASGETAPEETSDPA